MPVEKSKVKIDGNKATLDQIKASDLTLIKVDGQWKFDPAATTVSTPLQAVLASRRRVTATIASATVNTVPLTLAFNHLKPACGIVASAAAISFACVLIALWALRGLEETYDKELDYLEPV